MYIEVLVTNYFINIFTQILEYSLLKFYSFKYVEVFLFMRPSQLYVYLLWKQNKNMWFDLNIASTYQNQKAMYQI